MEPVQRAVERKQYQEIVGNFTKTEPPSRSERSEFGIELDQAKRKLADGKYEEYQSEIRYLNSIKATLKSNWDTMAFDT